MNYSQMVYQREQDLIKKAGLTGKIDCLQVENNYPIDNDNVDAYISYAEMDGIPLTEEQLDDLNECSSLRQELIYDYNH